MSKLRTRPDGADPAPQRVADDITRGMRELERMMAEGARPEERFTVRRAELPPAPKPYTPQLVRLTREGLGVSQPVFAALLAVSPQLVKAWEQGSRRPAPIARRLLDAVNDDPQAWRRLVGAGSSRGEGEAVPQRTPAPPGRRGRDKPRPRTSATARRR
jgi:DNA-binding transcriptional regulator YiaG